MDGNSDPGEGARVHVAGEEWTRLALELLEAEDGRRPVLWELLPGRIVAGGEDGSHRGAPASPGGEWTLQLDGAAVGRQLDGAAGLRQPAAGSGLRRRRRDAPTPGVRDAGLVTVDVEPGRRILVDVAAAGVTTVAGVRDDCDALLRRFAAELVERRWAPLARLVLVGLPALPASAGAGDETTVVTDLVAAAAVLAEAGLRPERGSTVVLVAPHAVGDTVQLDRLVALAGDGSGLAVVVGSPWPGARCTMAASRGGARADVFLRPSMSDGAAMRAAAAVIERPAAVALPIAPLPLTTGGPQADPGSVEPGSVEPGSVEPGSVEPGSVEIAVLGRVEVRGVDESFARRPRLKELVVFLALHPAGASTSTWTTALWPGRRVPPQTVANRLSEARRFLGFASDDRPRLRRSGDVHRIAEVDTDWAQFQALAASPDADAWRQALALVRGRPFEDLPSGLWTALEIMAVEMERTITECALRYGARLLEAGDADGAAWAAHQGLRACPWDERLHRLLMRTADATGNRAGVEATLRHLALVLEVDGDPLHHVHPETAALYHQLVGRTG